MRKEDPGNIPRKVVYPIPERNEGLIISENGKVTAIDDKAETEAEKTGLLYISKRVYEIIQYHNHISGTRVNLRIDDRLQRR
jgi:hypothetical protein